MITVYSKDKCPNCISAMNYLDNNNIDYVVIKIDLDQNARNFLVSNGHRAVPQVYADNKHLGGWPGIATVSPLILLKEEV